MSTASETVERNRFSVAFGYPKDTVVGKLKPYLTRYVQEFVKHSPFVVMATSDAAGNCDASPKGGKPGFVRVLDDKHLLFPDVAGNKLFQSYQNVEANPHVGLLFVIPGMNETVRVNGKVTIIDKEELERRNVDLSLYEYDDNSKHLQGMLIEVKEAYGHCPRAFKFSRLWDADEIAANQAARPRPRQVCPRVTVHRPTSPAAQGRLARTRSGPDECFPSSPPRHPEVLPSPPCDSEPQRTTPHVIPKRSEESGDGGAATDQAFEILRRKLLRMTGGESSK